MDVETSRALVAEGAKRSDLVWVRARGSATQPRAMWHVWSDGTFWLLTGGSEQPAPDGLDESAQAEITLRSKDNGSRLGVVVTTVARVEPGGEQWDAVVPALAAKRLNSQDGEAAPARWARECVLLRLDPTDEMLETPDAPSGAYSAAQPVPTSATTPVPRPWQLLSRRARRSGPRRRRRPDR